MHWLKAAADRLPVQPPLPEEVTLIEQAELCPFLEQKKNEVDVMTMVE
jgi:hypothetical protein